MTSGLAFPRTQSTVVAQPLADYPQNNLPVAVCVCVEPGMGGGAAALPVAMPVAMGASVVTVTAMPVHQ